MKYASVLLALGCLVTAVHPQWLETTIPLDSGSAPNALCYNTQNNKVYCTGEISHNVTVVDGATNGIVATVPAGSRPWALCYNPTNNKVYCADVVSNAVVVIDGRTDGVVASIPVGGSPVAFCHNSVQNRMYGANYDSSSISVIRDSMSGVEESFKPQAPSRKLAASVIRSLPQGAVAFDAMGRRVADPRSGIFFVREAQTQVQAVRKVVITR